MKEQCSDAERSSSCRRAKRTHPPAKTAATDRLHSHYLYSFHMHKTRFARKHDQKNQHRARTHWRACWFQWSSTRPL